MYAFSISFACQREKADSQGEKLFFLLFYIWAERKYRDLWRKPQQQAQRICQKKGGVVHSENSAWRKCPRDASKSSWPPHRSWCTSQKKRNDISKNPFFLSLSLDGTLVSTCLSLRLFSGGSLLFLFSFFRFSSLCHTFIFWGGSFNSRWNISVRPPISKLSTATCVHVNKGVNFSSFFF